LTVDGEAPFHLLTWLVAIDAAHNQARREIEREVDAAMNTAKGRVGGA